MDVVKDSLPALLSDGGTDGGSSLSLINGVLKTRTDANLASVLGVTRIETIVPAGGSITFKASLWILAAPYVTGGVVMFMSSGASAYSEIGNLWDSWNNYWSISVSRGQTTLTNITGSNHLATIIGIH